MRGADSGPWKQICALPAFWVGLLYDDEALDEAENIAQNFSFELLQRVRDDVPKSGLDLKIDGFDMLDLARRVLDVSEKGLKNRAVFNKNGKDETIHLAPLQEIAHSGKTRADLMLDLYNADWQQDASQALK